MVKITYPRKFPLYNTSLYRRVADLSRQQLMDWMRLNQPVLMNIFKRKEYSWRHEEFNTNPKMRGKSVGVYHSPHHLPLLCPLLQLQWSGVTTVAGLQMIRLNSSPTFCSRSSAGVTWRLMSNAVASFMTMHSSASIYYSTSTMWCLCFYLNHWWE